MKVIFVGMHNKPNMKPLDSRTMSGKKIDSIIQLLPFNCIKTNLCECDYLPKNKLEIAAWNNLWYDKYNPASYDIVVLLGNWVRDNFNIPQTLKIVKLPHPASIMGKLSQEKYINDSVKKITQP